MNLDDTLKLDAQLCFLLYTATRAVTQAYGPLLGPLGLTYPQYLVMLVLWEQDGVSVGQLGQRLYLDSGTLTPLLKRMEAQGLVERRRSRRGRAGGGDPPEPRGAALRERATGVPSALFCRTGLTLKAGVRLAEELHQVLDGLKMSNEHGPTNQKGEGADPMSTPLYETTVTAHGGRAGHAESTDGRLAVPSAFRSRWAGPAVRAPTPSSCSPRDTPPVTTAPCAWWRASRSWNCRRTPPSRRGSAWSAARPGLYQLAVKLSARLPGVAREHGAGADGDRAPGVPVFERHPGQHHRDPGAGGRRRPRVVEAAALGRRLRPRVKGV